MARVLLLEDDELQLEIRQRLLELSGHTVLPAGTCEEADRQRDYDVVVADLVPGCVEFLSSVQGRVRVIVLSGRAVIPGKIPADVVLAKPCSTRELLAAIDQLH